MVNRVSEERMSLPMTRLGWSVVLAVGLVALAIAPAFSWAGMSAFRAVLLGLNLATMVAYGFDKLRARAGLERVPEFALHLLTLCGGTFGALAGQLMFRHKTRDTRFRLIFLAIAALQVLALFAVRGNR